MPSSTITALYDSRSDAEAVVEDLVSAGVPRAQMSLVNQSASATTATKSHTEGGFLSSLRDLFLPEDDVNTYAEGIRRGGTLLTIRSAGTDDDSVIAVLEGSNAVDIDARASEWRSAGWTGAVSTSEAGSARTAGRNDEAIIPVLEEQLKVGKREVARGGLRVRSYIVETPVEEQVTLRDEHVTIERRSVDLPLSAGDAALFQEKTIEVTATGEEAVVAKTARVKEELVIHKDVEQRTERIADTVRHTEVEVEDTRSEDRASQRPLSTNARPDRR